MGENGTTDELVYGDVRSFEVNRTQQGTTQQTDILIPGLPNEIAVLCIARLRRSHHRNISGVCRSWRNLLHGRILSEVRRELSLVEEWLYLWNETAAGRYWCCFDPCLQKWWKLPAMPHDNRIDIAVASLDGKLFAIGGILKKTCKPCKIVSYFDARSYCWKRVADLNIARAFCKVGIINNQLYVFGGYSGNWYYRGYSGESDPTITAETYDPITNAWRFISSMKHRMDMCDSVVMGGKFYAIDICRELKAVAYDAQKDKWEETADGLNDGWEAIHKATVLNGKLYTVEDEYLPEDLEYEYEFGFPGYNLEHNQLIQVYKPSKDVWEVVNTFWSGRVDKLEMKDAELIILGGMICIISVKTLSNQVTKTCMVIFEVEDSTENQTCSVIFSGEFKTKWIAEPRNERWGIGCQVVAL